MATASPSKTSRTQRQKITQHYMDQVASEQAGLIFDEARMRPPIRLGVKSKYLFRSEPGTNPGISIFIQSLPDQYRDERQMNTELARFKRKFSEDQQAMLDQMIAKNGGSKFLNFVRTPHRECYFGTDDPATAAYIKELMDRGELPNVYLEMPGKSISVNGMEFPDTQLGWDAAQAYLRDTAGIETAATTALDDTEVPAEDDPELE